MDRELCEEKSRNNMVSSAGFCYSDVSPSNNPSPTHIQTQFTNQIQEFHESNPEIFNLTTGMEMIGFSKSNLQNQSTETNTNNNTTAATTTSSTTNASPSSMWKGFSTISKAAGPSSSKTIDESTTGHDHNHQHHQFYDHFTTGISETSSENLMVGPDHHQQQQQQSTGAWQENRFLVDDSSLRCVFPCEGNERPSQGLSLSLSSANPSSIGLQSFELRQTNHQQDHDHMRFLSPSSSRDGYFGKAANMQTQQMNINMNNQDGFLGKAMNLHHQQGQFQLRNSKYLNPAQELLNEFCSLGTKHTDLMTKQKSQKMSKQSWEDQADDGSGASSSKNKSLYSLEFMELQKRKAKLLSMLEEVERRYKHYCDQMKAVVSSFEAVAGAGAATVYSALASKAMSRHFRCLKDGIVNQIQATRKAMGEKDATGAAPGTTRGETPRLRLLDQTLRQQRAFQQMTMMETHPWRPQRGLPERSVSVLRAWLFEHFLHPYPSDVDKVILARQTGLSRSQVSNWFINARVRLWKPMVEEMYLEETKEREANNNMAAGGASSSSPDHGVLTVDILGDPIRHPGRNNQTDQEQKPTHEQLVRIDSECLSSIVINPEKSPMSRPGKTALESHQQNIQRQQNFGRFGEVSFGSSMQELDFSSYNHQAAAGGAVLYHENNNVGFNGGGGGVSLTLGLQQHAGGGGGGVSHGGVSLAFSHPGSQSSLFYSRDHHMDECQPAVQYSLLDGEGQNLPYRNLMGAQLLHDLA